MRFIKLSGTVLAGALWLAACSSTQPDQTAEINPYPREVTRQQAVAEAGSYYARENLDLQTIGPILEKADNAEELEYLLNSDPRINNLDLNRDGYADYISVAEFEDRNDGMRGLSLFSRFGPDLIQEIATIIFDRGNRFDSPGARILLTGNEDLYGDNYSYETNWLDRALPIVSSLFSNRNSTYESPYYYNNYPDYYRAYEVVETPVYLTRVREVYTEPVFVYTTNPASFRQIEIRSPYQGRTVANYYPKPVKEGKLWVAGRGNAQGPPETVPVRKGWIKNGAPKSDTNPKEFPGGFEKPGKNNEAKLEKRERPNKAWKNEVKAPKIDRPKGNPNKPAARVETPKMKPPKADNPGRGKGGNNGGGKGGKKN